MADQHAQVAHVVGQGVDDFVVEKFQQLVAGVDQVDLDAQVAKHRRVFAADDAGAVDRDRLRREVEVQDRVAVENARMAEIDVGRTIGPRAGGNARTRRPSAVACRRSPSRLRPCARRRTAPGRRRSARDCARKTLVRMSTCCSITDAAERRSSATEKLQRDARLAKQRVAVGLGHLKDGVPQGLAGNRAPVGAAAADAVELFDHAPRACRA